jgi:hypothetical protein
VLPTLTRDARHGSEINAPPVDSNPDFKLRHYPLISFWGVALVAGSRRWILKPSRGQILGFLCIGILITVGMEWLSTQVLHRWAYGPAMPVLPGLRVGLSPVLQWVVIPPVVVWFTRRLIAGIAVLRQET